MEMISPSRTNPSRTSPLNDMVNDEGDEKTPKKYEMRDGNGGEAIAKVAFPSYPSHGIIGSSNPPWLDAFYISHKKGDEEKRNDFRKQKFDFHEIYEKKLDERRSGRPVEPTPLPGLYNLWQRFNNGRRTSDIYPTTDPSLPKRFQQPELLQGYGCERDENPFFTTVSSAYGRFPPTIHDVPREYHALKNSFTSHLASTGMPKNRSLNIK